MLHDIRYADLTEEQIASIICPRFKNEKILVEEPLVHITNDPVLKKEPKPLVKKEHDRNHDDNMIPFVSRSDSSIIGFTSTDTTEKQVVQTKHTNYSDATTQPDLSFPHASHPKANMDNPKDVVELIQSQIQKLALNEDLLDLKRTVDRMQQERASDLQEHLARLEEQRKRERDMLDQIHATKERLEKAIADGLFEQENQSRATSSKPAHNEPSADPRSNYRHHHSHRQHTHRHRPVPVYEDASRPWRHGYHETQHEPPEFNPYFPDLTSLAFDDFMPPPPPPPLNAHYPLYYHHNQQPDPSPYFSYEELARRRGMMPFDIFMPPHPNPFPPPFAMRPPSPSRGRRTRKRSKSTDTPFYQSDGHRERGSCHTAAEELPPTPYSRSRKSSLHSAKSDLSHEAEQSGTLDPSVGVELHDNPVPFDLSSHHQSQINDPPEKQQRSSLPSAHRSRSGHAQWKIKRASRHEPDAPSSHPPFFDDLPNNRLMEGNDRMMAMMMMAATPSINAAYGIYHASLPPYLPEGRAPYQPSKKGDSPDMLDAPYPEVQDRFSNSHYSRYHSSMPNNGMNQGKSQYGQPFFDPAQTHLLNQREQPSSSSQANHSSIYPTDRIYM
ncbi:hypothetical protein A0J61_10461 [Choanephora cucurbitarum]|uniref:Uncharacterized protein n=1 Tax=Choanephora cucurbitarum TaxID=101091 RepID=A0A1C7MXF0_9FUNG|nr:hypothetical protein A0J61_10461 [Choanephora cucurbitarum]